MTAIKRAWDYTFAALKWLPAAALVGLAGGAAGVAFHFCIRRAALFRHSHSWVVWLLPIGAILVTACYRLLRLDPETGVNCVIDAVQDGKRSIPLALAPAIFLGTALSHFFGGSVGREGAALQIGGSLGYSLGRLFHMEAQQRQLMVLCGMTAVFSALFGTPVAAVMFVLEVISVGRFFYGDMIPCLVASLVAYLLNVLCGAEQMRLSIAGAAAVTAGTVLQATVLALLCALVSILFCVAVHRCESYAAKWIRSPWLRALALGTLLLGMTLLSGGQTYNGTGMETVELAVSGGGVLWYAALVKLLFTAVSLAAGYRGGEIVPTFFVGAVFGAAVGPLLGLDASLAAALGMIGVFCGVVNCPIASTILAVEIFGGEYLTLFAITCMLSYVFSGYFGLYRSQLILRSKVGTEMINIHTIE